MATGAIIGGAIAAAGSIVGAGISTGGSVASTNSANRQSYKMFREQLDYNTQQTDPAYIRQRLENAGYNASLLAGNTLGSTSSAPAAPQVQRPDYSAVATGIQNAVNAYMQYKANEANISKQNAETEQIHIDNQTRAAQNLAEINQIYESTHSTRARRQLDEIAARFQDRIYQSELQLNAEHINQIKEQTRGQAMENVMSSVRLKSFPELVRLEVANSAADLAIKRQTQRLNEKQMDKLVAETANVIARTYFTQEQTRTQEQLTGSARAASKVDNESIGERIETIKAEMYRAINNSGVNSPYQILDQIKQRIHGWRQ